MSSGRSQDSIFTYTLAKFVVLAVAVLALIVFLVIWLALDSDTLADNEPTFVAEATGVTLVPSATATDVPPSRTRAPTRTLVPRTDTLRPTLTNTRQPAIVVTEVAQITVAPTATSTLMPTATATPSLTPTPMPTVAMALIILSPEDGAAAPPGRLVISGLGAPDARVNVVGDGALLASTTVDGTGSWSVTVPQGLPSGEHVLRAEAFDSGGEIIDTAGPVTLSVLAAVIPQSGGDELPLAVMLLVVAALLALALVFVLGGAVLREWERARRQ